MENYLLIIGATVLLALDFALSKKYQSKVGTTAKAGLFFNAANGLLTAIVFFAISGFKFTFTPYSAIMAALMSCFAMCYSIIGFKVLKMGSMSLYTVFLMTGGMILPYIYGTILLDEEFSILRLIGLIMIFGAIILSNAGKTKATKWLVLLCVAVFVLNGLVSIVSKQHQIESTYATVSASEFVMWSGITKLIISGIGFLFVMKDKSSVTEGELVRALPIVAISAVIGGVSYLLQLIGAAELPATMLYPCVTGGSIIFSSLAGLIFFKEKISVKQWCAVALCFVGTCMFI